MDNRTIRHFPLWMHFNRRRKTDGASENSDPSLSSEAQTPQDIRATTATETKLYTGAYSDVKREIPRIPDTPLMNIVRTITLFVIAFSAFDLLFMAFGISISGPHGTVTAHVVKILLNSLCIFLLTFAKR